MRKSIIASNGYALVTPEDRQNDWLDLATIAHVELSSEDAAHPVEQALTLIAAEQPTGHGWCAAGPGAQTLRLRFDEPIRIKRVLLHFREAEQERMQEFSLNATTANGQTNEIVRQQWSFSPGGSTDERENYLVNLDRVTALTLWIDPDRGMNRYPATLQSLRVEG
jgi:hypothetical protein